MNHIGSRVDTKTTTKLQVGDVIQNGNIFDGFIYYQVVAIEQLANKPRSAKLTIKFNHGGSESLIVGKNAHWDVVM